jgi:hypothetical protein
LNIWYPTLNCGPHAYWGETDFPCITDERVGAGRSYVQLTGSLTYDAWCDGLRNGRSYVSDGRAHLMDFAANGTGVGVGASELPLNGPSRITVTAQAACLLPDRPPDVPAGGRRAYWTPEHARIPGTRDVTVEAVVNGRAVASQRIRADGSFTGVRLDVPVERSSWLALRIPGSAHTNPIFVPVGGRPIRASRRSARWCLAAVDRCWSQRPQDQEPRA